MPFLPSTCCQLRCARTPRQLVRSKNFCSSVGDDASVSKDLQVLSELPSPLRENCEMAVVGRGQAAVQKARWDITTSSMSHDLLRPLSMVLLLRLL